MVEDVKKFILVWNSKNLIDRWWRRKYNIPLFSEAHLNAKHTDMFMEFLEDRIFRENSKDKDKNGNLADVYRAGSGDIFKVSIQELTEDEFDKLDISSFKDVK